jgi:hypothetical protein
LDAISAKYHDLSLGVAVVLDRELSSAQAALSGRIVHTRRLENETKRPLRKIDDNRHTSRPKLLESLDPEGSSSHVQPPLSPRLDEFDRQQHLHEFVS